MKKYAFDDEKIKMAWKNYKPNQVKSPKMQCLITGKILHVARLHQSIKSVRNTQSSGVLLIAFNALVSKYANFAYTTALNDLLYDSNHVKYFGDFWRYDSCILGGGKQRRLPK